MRFTGAILAILALTGCVNKRTSKLTAIEDAGQSAMASIVATTFTAAAVVPPATAILLWEKVDTNPQTVTQVWSTTNLLDWEIYGEFSEPRCVVIVNLPQQFFKIRNRLGEEYSDWDRKEP